MIYRDANYHSSLLFRCGAPPVPYLADSLILFMVLEYVLPFDILYFIHCYRYNPMTFIPNILFIVNQISVIR